MRILHLIHSEGVYGAELILLYLAREQQQRGHEPLVGSIRDPRTEQTPFEALAQSWGLPVVGIRIASRPTPPVVRSLLRTVREVAPDVLHSHGYKANILLGPLPRRLRGPMIATLHGWTAARTFSALCGSPTSPPVGSRLCRVSCSNSSPVNRRWSRSAGWRLRSASRCCWRRLRALARKAGA